MLQQKNTSKVKDSKKKTKNINNDKENSAKEVKDSLITEIQPTEVIGNKNSLTAKNVEDIENALENENFELTNSSGSTQNVKNLILASEAESFSTTVNKNVMKQEDKIKMTSPFGSSLTFRKPKISPEGSTFSSKNESDINQVDKSKMTSPSGSSQNVKNLPITEEASTSIVNNENVKMTSPSGSILNLRKTKIAPEASTTSSLFLNNESVLTNVQDKIKTSPSGSALSLRKTKVAPLSSSTLVNESAINNEDKIKLTSPSGSALSLRKTKVAPLSSSSNVLNENESTSTVIATNFTSSTDSQGSQALVIPQPTNTFTSRIDLKNEMNMKIKEQRSAYIPYLFARNCIARMEDDMLRMKTNHVRIVNDIQTVYVEIEEDSQRQVGAFSNELKKQYNERLSSYKQVIEVLRKELDRVREEEKASRESLETTVTSLLTQKNFLLREKEAWEARLEEINVENEMRQLRESLKAEKSMMTDVVECVELIEKQEASTSSQGPTDTFLQAHLAIMVVALDFEKVSQLSDKYVQEYDLNEKSREALARDIENYEIEFKKVNDRLPNDADWSDKEKQLYFEKADNEKRQENLLIQIKILDDFKSNHCFQKLESKIPQVEPPMLNEETSIAQKDEIPETNVKEREDSFKEMIELREKVVRLTADKNYVQELELQLEEVRAAMNTMILGNTAGENVNDTVLDLRHEVDTLDARLREEQAAHLLTKDELEALRAQNRALAAGTKTIGQCEAAEARAASSEKEAERANLEARELRLRIEALVASKMVEMPETLQNELIAEHREVVKARQEAVASAAECTAAKLNLSELEAKVEALNKQHNFQKKILTELEKKFKDTKDEKSEAIKQLNLEWEKKEVKRALQDVNRIHELENQLKAMRLNAGAGGLNSVQIARLHEQISKLQMENKDLKKSLKEQQQNNSSTSTSTVTKGGISEFEKKKMEKILKELEKKLDAEKTRCTKLQETLSINEKTVASSNQLIQNNEQEIIQLRAKLEMANIAATEVVALNAELQNLKKDNKKYLEEINHAVENYNTERVLRKKYYNMVEDMKGKIRVYCRARPLGNSELKRGNHSIISSPDEYSINIHASRGVREFQFDQVFMPEHSQEKVFEDTYNLVQSAVDGYNVCIFAYGQTGSGKTYTMIGTEENPGIAPRSFRRIFDLFQENVNKFTFKLSIYMLELYNDKLLDLFVKNSQHDDKLDIKKDKKGMVYIPGAQVKFAESAQELNLLFEEGSNNRHIASTSMNAESSRSHLILGIIIESTNKATGQITKGKLSLVDLAGSERFSKTNATPEQLKEANSINRSLSALGDVISALSSDQQFIPYRNNKLTMLMQDSLGGNSKTLMFVNISPADYNSDESVVSLTYASRVKLITNDAQKNSDNKEIARLKAIIAKLKHGETVEEEVE